jgi:hypothetical protein
MAAAAKKKSFYKQRSLKDKEAWKTRYRDKFISNRYLVEYDDECEFD